MSYATGTTHYNLPQTVGSDKRDWTDTNQAFSDLDTAVYGAAQGAEAATSAIQTINSELDVMAGKQATDEENITTLNGKVSTLESTTSTLGAQVLDVRQDLQDNIESKHEASATSTHAYAIGDTFYYNDILYKATAAIAIGDTIVPTVNCMGITVMSQVSAIKGDLTASDGLGFKFMTDGDGNYGYRGADDSFVPFSSGGSAGKKWIKINGTHSGGYTYEDSNSISISETGESNFVSAINGKNDALAYDVSMDYAAGTFSLKIKYSGDFIVVGENKQTVITSFTADTSFSVYHSTAFAVEGMAYGIGNIFIES